MEVAETRSVFSWEDFQIMKNSLAELKIKLSEFNLVLAKQLKENHPEYAKTLSSTVSLVLLVNYNIDKVYIEVDATIDKVLSLTAPQGAV